MDFSSNKSVKIPFDYIEMKDTGDPEYEKIAWLDQMPDIVIT